MQVRSPRDPSSEPLTAPSNGDIAMTANTSIDPARLPARAAGPGQPGSDAGAARHVHQRAAVRAGRQRVRRRVRHPQRRTGSTPATATGTATSTPAPARSTWRSRSCARGRFFPDWLLERHRRAEAALTTVVATCYLLGVSHPPDGQAGPDARDHRPVQVAGVGDGQGPRRAGRRVPHPAAGRRARTRSSPRTR